MADQTNDQIKLRAVTKEDGGDLFRLAEAAGELDVNSSYAYLLWSRDFGATSVLAILDGKPVGFVTGYMRPEDPKTLFVWQVGVDANARGRGVASKMLEWLADETDASRLETTITADNDASIALFERFAASRSASIDTSPLFEVKDFPDGHSTEYLYEIAPLGADV